MTKKAPMEKTAISTEINQVIDLFDTWKETDNLREKVNGFTINPIASTDLSKAIWIEKEGSLFHLTVSIPDVAHFIDPNSLLFSMVRKRQLSTFYGKQFRKMFPPILSEKKFNFLLGELRPVISFNFEIDTKLTINDLYIEESKLESCYNFAIEEAAKIINKKEKHQYSQQLNWAAELALALFQKRQKNGAFAFSNLQKGIYTNEEGLLVTVEEKESTIALLIIQELTILINTTIASFFASNEIPFIFRNHDMKWTNMERAEISKQYADAMKNEKQLEQLEKRLKILSYSTQLSTKLTEHFALNIAAYCHQTSPTNNFEDLVNQFQIKSFINDQPTVFEQEQLDRFCKELNKGAEGRKERESKFCKDEEQAKVIQLLNEGTFESLATLSFTDFCKVMNVFVEQKITNPVIDEIGMYHIHNTNLNSFDQYCLLKYAMHDNDGKKLLGSTLQLMRQHKGFASQILQFLLKDYKITKFQEDAEQIEPQYFAARIIGITPDNQVLSPKYYVMSRSKRDALNESATLWVEAYFKNKLVDAQKVYIENAISLKDKEITSKNWKNTQAHNYYGQLLELLNYTNKKQIQSIEYWSSGPSHKPNFECKITFLFYDRLLEFSAISHSKLESKQLASKDIIDFIEENDGQGDPDTMEFKPGFIQKFIVEENFPGLLQTFIRQDNRFRFEYQFEPINEIIDNSDNQFVCILKITGEESIYEFKAEHATKKGARKLTAKQALETLFSELMDQNSY